MNPGDYNKINKKREAKKVRVLILRKKVVLVVVLDNRRKRKHKRALKGWVAYKQFPNCFDLSIFPKFRQLPPSYSPGTKLNRSVSKFKASSYVFRLCSSSGELNSEIVVFSGSCL